MALNPHSAGSIRAPSIDNSFQSDAGSAYHVVVGSDDAYRVESLSDDEVSPPEDDYDIFDLELVTSVGAKQTEISVRRRNPTLTSSGRPTYKVEKKTISHFLGKKNMAVVINRNEGLSAVNSSRSRMHPKGYAPIFEAHDENTRQITMTATPQCVLSGTVRGNRITISPSCGSYDPQNSRTHRRDGAAYHFFALVISDLSSSPPGVESSDPMEISKPSYPGGGYFVFDASSHGRKELLCSLYCTRYDKRHRVYPDDILVAELRLPNLPNTVSSSSPKSRTPSWTRLFREHHASLHISKRAIDACFSGDDVKILASKPVPGKRHFFTREQGLEIIVSVMTMSLLAIEHDGLESKKWVWLTSREAMEQPAVPRKVEVDVRAGPDRTSIASRDTLMSTREHPETAQPHDGTDWTVMSYNSEMSLRRAAGVSAREPSFIEDGENSEQIYAASYAPEPSRESFDSQIRHSAHAVQLVS